MPNPEPEQTDNMAHEISLVDEERVADDEAEAWTRAHTWSGAVDNWIAPFHTCPHCGDSLDWSQHEDVFDRPIISAKCCGIHHAALLAPTEPEQTDG